MDVVAFAAALAKAKIYVNGKIAEIASGFNLKGTLPKYTDLPTTATKGDVYLIEESGKAYVWLSDKWNHLELASDSAVESASQYAQQAGNYATQAGNKAVEAMTAADEAKTVVWKGTQAEYNALTVINPNTIYFILG